MTDPKLEPCPHCSSTDLFVGRRRPVYPIMCKGCGATANDPAAWNRRATPQPEGLAAELEKLDANATPAPFYTLDQPWLTSGETSILAESPDPHVARYICDFDLGMFVDEDDKTSECPQADADLLVWLRNHVPEILAALKGDAS